MRREDILEGMEVEHRIASDEPWESGHVDSIGNTAAVISCADGKFVYRFIDEIEPLGTAAGKEA